MPSCFVSGLSDPATDEFDEFGSPSTGCTISFSSRVAGWVMLCSVRGLSSPSGGSSASNSEVVVECCRGVLCAVCTVCTIPLSSERRLHHAGSPERSTLPRGSWRTQSGREQAGLLFNGANATSVVRPSCLRLPVPRAAWLCVISLYPAAEPLSWPLFS